MTLGALSDEFGISRERVRQIEVRAFEKVQSAVKARALLCDNHRSNLKARGWKPLCRFEYVHGGVPTRGRRSSHPPPPSSEAFRQGHNPCPIAYGEAGRQRPARLTIRRGVSRRRANGARYLSKLAIHSKSREMLCSHTSPAFDRLGAN